MTIMANPPAGHTAAARPKVPAQRRKPAKPVPACPAWCAGRCIKDARGRIIGHAHFAAEVQRPDRHLTKLEQLTEKFTGRRPSLVEVRAHQYGASEPSIELTVAGVCATLTPDEAERVGWALLQLGFVLGGGSR